MSAPKHWITPAVLSTALVLAVACQDERSDLLDPQVQAAKVCPPGQSKKGCVPTEPPPPPDLHLPVVVVDQLASPLRIDRTPWNWLLLTDSRLNMVLRVDPGTLQPIEGFETQGRPLGVTALGQSIFVGNATARTVDVYNADGGAFASTFGPGAVDYPADLAADPILGFVFVLDGEQRRVRVYNAQGNLLNTISGPGTLPDQLENPTAMGLDPTRQWVMVSDYGSADGGDASLKIFGYDGSLIKQLSGAGSCGMLGCSGGFSRPQGAAVDAQGLIYLPDALLAQVLLYDPVSWNQTGTLGDHGFLRVPTDVVFDDFGDLFIASNRTREVQVVRGVGQP